MGAAVLSMAGILAPVTRTLAITMIAAALAAGCDGADARPDAGPPPDASQGVPDAATPDAAPPGCADPAALEALVDAQREKQLAAGIVVGVLRRGRCESFATSGVSDLEQMAPLRPDDRFRIGSISKSFTAALILLHVAEGRLSLDDTLAEHVPSTGLPDAGAITVRMLLNHTSGVFNYTDSLAFLADTTRPYTPEELVAFAAAEEPYFPPGQGWHYSNTGYVLLGMIAEAVGEGSFAAQVRARLFDPLALADTFLEGDETIPGGFVPGYFHATPDTWVRFDDAIHPSAAWAAGSIVSTARDVATWAAELFEGDLLPANLRQEMVTPAILPDGTNTYYGYGIGAVPTSYGPVLAHSGAIHGFTADLSYFPDHDAAFVVLVNEHGSAAWDLAPPAWNLVLGP